MGTTRRQFLETVTVAAGTLAALGPERAWGLDTAAASLANFPQGVASGDPKPSSVILWTRATDPRRPGLDLPLRLQVATSERFAAGTVLVDVVLTAHRADDGCVRVKVTGLHARRHYWYRFRLAGAVSPIGRTKTAPAANDPVAVKFAYASCQDYIGRYYNSYLAILTPEMDDLDFVVHLGDFIYETTGDPQFQDTGGERTIQFRDEAGAIRLGDPDSPFFAARSLDNYRQLHRTYRADALLREVLGRFPLVAIWDDHEFSDDSWRDNANYFDGRRPSSDNGATARKRQAERAWLEYMPIDDAASGGGTRDILDTSPDRLYPRIRIWRNLRYGRTINLTLSDYRSYRPDHPIPEDGFPGRVVATEAALQAKYAELAAQGFPVEFTADRLRFEPYVAFADLAADQRATLRAAFAREYAEAGYQGADGPVAKARRELRGDLAINYLNLRLGPTQQIIRPTAPRGLTYEMIGKRELFADFGARYALNQEWFDLFTQFRTAEQEDVYRSPQQRFLLEQIRASDATWNLFCGSVSNTAMVVDLAVDLAALPIDPVLKAFLIELANALGRPRILLNADQWDGFPNRREVLLDAYREKGNVILIAGDIHSSWVTDHSGERGALFEFTGTAISSATFSALIVGALGAGAQDLPPGALDALVQVVSQVLIARRPGTRFRPNLEQRLEFVDIARNGIVVVEGDATSFRTTYFLLPSDTVGQSFYEDREAALALFERKQFEVRGGQLTSL